MEALLSRAPAVLPSIKTQTQQDKVTSGTRLDLENIAVVEDVMPAQHLRNLCQLSEAVLSESARVYSCPLLISQVLLLEQYGVCSEVVYCLVRT
jgi:hypothetical protein